MGSSFSCCTAPATPRVAPRKRTKRDKGRAAPPVILERSDPLLAHDSITRSCAPVPAASLLQHISEREPDDMDLDPSTNPRTGPLFMQQRSRSDVRSMRERRQSQLNLLLEARSLKKSSSCSTIFLDDSTISHPNLKNTIKCVSLAIHFHFQDRGQGDTGSKTYAIFDERIHPLSQDVRDIRVPDHRTIYRFMRTLFNAAQLPPECAIITLVYVERLLTYAETELHPFTWKRIVLGSIILASKVWDDQAVWNVDYCQILRDISVEDMNDLERYFLELLQFNINVPQSVYAKYYFDLRTLADQSDITFLLEPLSKERAGRMEAMSKQMEEKSGDPVCNGVRKWSSLENMSPVIRSRAILS